MTASLAASAVLAAVAVQFLLAPRPRQVTRRLRGSLRTVILVGSAALLLIVGLHGRRLVLGAIALAVALAGMRLWRQLRSDAAARRRGELAMVACEAVAADLAAGQPPGRSLGRASRDWPELAPAAAAARLDADVPSALSALAERPGAGDLAAVAATWQVAHRNGAGLADALERTVGELRAEASTRRVVAAELASARATAWLIALLPVGVLLFGSGLGGDPFGFLLDTPAGLVCLAAGSGLTVLGLHWLQVISMRALR